LKSLSKAEEDDEYEEEGDIKDRISDIVWMGKSTHCNENLIYVLPEKKLRCLSPNFHILISVIYPLIQAVSDLLIIYSPAKAESALKGAGGRGEHNMNMQRRNFLSM
jgi:hypothetical protein